MCHIVQQSGFWPIKDTNTFTLIESIKVMREKGCRRTDENSAKSNLKASCSGISYDRNSIEFQF